MNSINQAFLKPFAKRYIWWETPELAVARPLRVIAQVMNLGDYEDVVQLQKEIGNETFIAALVAAEAGQFNERSWHFWHLKLGVSKFGEVPSLPSRKLQ